MTDIDKYALITDLSIKYADRMCEGNRDATFCRSDIAAAYQIGAIDALTRICNTIKEITVIAGLSEFQASRLLYTINAIESMPSDN